MFEDGSVHVPAPHAPHRSEARRAHVASQLPSEEQQYGSSLQTRLQHEASEQNGVVAAAQQSLVLVPHVGGGGAFGVICS
jgi:hypothetical protein